MRSQTVTTEAGDVVVSKLALGKYADLLRGIKILPNELIKLWQGGESKLDMATFLPQLPVIAADAWPDFISILAVCTDRDSEWLSGNIDLSEAAEIFAVALELNDYQKVIATVKKIISRQAEATPATPSPSA